MRPGVRRDDDKNTTGEGQSDARQGRRPDHRLRRLGRRGGVEPRRHQDAHPLPRAGRLGEADRLSEQRPRLGGAAVQRFRHQSQPPGAADRLSDQRRQFADQGGEFQRRRRQHHHVHRAFPAPASLRLQGAHAGRRGRRLAGRLRHAGAVLRRERPHDGRLGPGRRSRLSAAPAADAAVAARQVGRALRQGDEQAGLALVAVRLHHRHDRLRRPRRAASISATARRAAPRAPRPAPTSPIGRMRSAPASSCARAAGCARSRPTSTAWPPA